MTPESIKKERKPDKSVWNPFNVLPNLNDEEWEFAMGMEYSLKKLCDMASEGDPSMYDVYWEKKSLSEVWDRLAILRSNLF